MKGIGIFFVALALFGTYALYSLNKQQGFKEGPYTATKPLISKEDNPEGFFAAQVIGGGFIIICLGTAIYFLRRK